MTDPPITVVVPTYRRPDLLRRCLTALSGQTLPTQQFAVIVVDDGNDPTVAVLVGDVSRESGLQLTYLGQPQRRGPAAARNRGWRMATTPVIAFTDDDCIPRPDWLSAALTQFRAGAQVVTGRVVMPLPDQPTAHDRTTALLGSAEFVTANCFCQRTALIQVNGFDEAFDQAWREDSALQFALLRAGIPIESCPDAVVVHPLRPARWYAALIDERKNRYDALLYKRYPDLFRARIPPYTGLVATYYGIVGAALATVGGLVTRNRPVARIGGTAWLALTAGLLAYRQRGLPAGELARNGLTATVSPFLSVYWRLYGAVKHRVWYW